ncbi:MAG: MotA/TolQ/ExbB proton channel family protein [Bdellovibrionales bacterium]|nr:MotA/TolQ/ExbB proton channel family protein [Bdellovibrionales bacterium]
MNFLSIIAFVSAGVVFFLGVFTSTDNPMAFVDGHAALIVFGGTISVAAISFQIDRIYLMLKIFYFRVIAGKKVEYVPIIRELMTLAEAYRTQNPQIRQMVAKSNDPFLRECMTMLLDDFLPPTELEKIMKTRMNMMYQRHNADAKKFKALGKFPPAMGLMGAVLGMIALLQTIGKPGSEEKIGPAMAIALVATLYGIAFANLVVLPIAENLMEGTKEALTKNMIIAEGVKLISQKKNRIILAEELNSFLLPNERVNWKEVIK